MRLFVAILFLCVPIVAHGATCPAGQYLENGECADCGTASYCPGDDMRYNCPSADGTNFRQLLTECGLHDIQENLYIWFNSFGSPTVTSCHAVNYDGIWSREGRFIIESKYNTESADYWNGCGSALFFSANTGYYLSGFNWSSYEDWYLGTKPCTNAPENAHYTGAGTPDDPVYGGRTDYNDCPWECDDGYGLHDGKCVPLCDNGATIFHAGDLVFNIYPIKYGVHNIVIGLSGGQCYVPLVSGSGAKAINININGEIWHTMN